MAMEKITKEELLEKLGGVPLSDDELETVAGGGAFEDCVLQASEAYGNCIGSPKRCYDDYKKARNACNNLL